MAVVEGYDQLIRNLEKERLKAEDFNVSVIVGYTQSYAVYVHENLEANHEIGQAKYLEQPLREFAREIIDIVIQTYRQTRNIVQSLLLGGLFLQRKSQELVPVDTGALKNSAFTRVA